MANPADLHRLRGERALHRGFAIVKQVSPSVDSPVGPIHSRSLLLRGEQMKPNTRRNSVTLSDGKRDDLLNRLDGKMPSASQDRTARRGSERRVDQRFEYRHRDIGLKVEHLGGGSSQLLVSGRNLSSGGVGFLHGAFLHPGSICQLELVTASGQVEHIAGKVVSCRHVEGTVHEVGVQFEQRLDPKRFVSSEADDQRAGLDSMEVPRIHGRLVYVEDLQAEAALLMHYLKPTGINISHVTAPGLALDEAKRGNVDYLFTDLDLDGDDGVELIKKLRESSFAGPIVVVTAETDAKRLHAATVAGADEILSLPYNAGELYQLLLQLQDRVSGLQGGKLYSTRSGDPALAQLITEFIKDATKRSELIQKAMEEQQLDAVRAVCLQFKGSAPAYGYEPLGEIASRIIVLIDDGSAFDATVNELRRMVIMCQSLGVRTQE